MIPKRGAIAGLLTALGLALLLSFKTPEIANLTSSQGTGSNTAFGGGSVTGNNNGNNNGGAGNGGAGNGGAAVTASAPTTGVGTTTTSGAKGSYSGSVTGQAIDIPFGTVQVKVTFQNGKITDVQALQLPNDQRHSAEISQYAGPRLRTQALQAQSSQINGVSGATYTSWAYQQSLQSALDQLPS